MINKRRALETHEAQTLSPYAILSMTSKGRLYHEKPPDTRTHFQRDWHRVSHSESFRKLEFKTQVLVYGTGLDFTRNRLTHTLEVAQIASAIARNLGVNDDLTRAIVLAHDLGHPPFGHDGEIALQACVENFNHNYHSFRVVALKEKRYQRFHGLNLTVETLDGILKHETGYDQPASYVRFPKDPRFNPKARPSLEGQVASISDELAYLQHDLEDALSLGVLSERQLDNASIALWEDVRPSATAPDPKVRRAQLTRRLIDLLVRNALTATNRRLNTHGIESSADVAECPEILVDFSQPTRRKFDDLREFLHENFYMNHAIQRSKKLGQRVIRDLFEAYEKNPTIRPPEMVQLIEKRKEEPNRIIADYIAGLTDKGAFEEHRAIFGPPLL
jgi:dGTPase